MPKILPVKILEIAHQPSGLWWKCETQDGQILNAEQPGGWMLNIKDDVAIKPHYGGKDYEIIYPLW